MERNQAFLGFAMGMLFCSLMHFSSPLAFGQATTGAILGTVSDASGGVIPDAEVTITSTATKQIRVLKTDASGRYDAEALLAGIYDIVVKKEGFTTYTIQSVKLDPSDRISADATLHPGSTITNVTVTASPVRVETETGESSGVISGQQVQTLLLNGRNFVGLALLVPGVNSTSGAQSQIGGGLTFSTNISINGGDPQLNNTTIDGTYNMNTGAFQALNVVTPLDSVSEFRVLKDNYSAKYGVNASAQIQ